MSRGIKYTLELYKEKLYTAKGADITFVGTEFLGVMIKQPHKCKHHGIWEVRPDSLIGNGRKKGCPKCDAETKRQAYTLSKVEVQRRLNLIHGGNIELVGNYTKNNVDVEFRCKKHNIVWATQSETVYRGYGCPKCSHSGYMKSTYKKKDYKLGRKIVQVQGYENFALDFILSKGIRPKDIMLGDAIPIIYYGNGKKHFPDLYIPKLNLIVEVKSIFTMLSTKELFTKQKKKCRAAIRMGYEYKLLVFDGKHKIAVPNDWYKLKYAEALSIVK